MRFDALSPLDRPRSRREFIRLAAAGTGVLLSPFGRMTLFAGTPGIRDVERMEFDVSYATRIIDPPRGSRRLRVWMPLPPASDVQEIHDLEITGPLPHEIRTERIYRNRLAFVESPPTAVPFTIVSRYRVVRHRADIAPAELPEEEKFRYLALTPRVKVTTEIRAWAERVAGTERRPIEVGRRIFTALIDRLDYDKTIPGCGTGDTEWIFRNRRGKCDDYHSLFMATMISRGIPVRWEQGFPLPYPSAGQIEGGTLEGDCTGAHCWASFHDPERGWVPVDVSEADQHPDLADFFFGHLSANRFQISEGRNLLLDPPQGGDALNSLAFAYAEADGIPLIYRANYENTIDYRVRRITTT